MAKRKLSALANLAKDFLSLALTQSGRCLGYQRRLAELFLKIMDKMDSKIGLEISLIVVEAIRGRCASFMVLTATVSEIFGGQTNSSILVV